MDLGNRILNWHEFKNRHNNIFDDIETILNSPMIRRNYGSVKRNYKD